MTRGTCPTYHIKLHGSRPKSLERFSISGTWNNHFHLRTCLLDLLGAVGSIKDQVGEALVLRGERSERDIQLKRDNIE